MTASGHPVTVVLDTTVVINLIQQGCLDLLGRLEGYVFVVPDQVINEVTYPDEEAVLAQALASGVLSQESSTDLREIERYEGFRNRMGKGEAACLAMAATRGWILASDDRGRAFMRMVRKQIGVDRLIDTKTIPRLTNDIGLLSPELVAQIERFLDG